MFDYRGTLRTSLLRKLFSCKTISLINLLASSDNKFLCASPPVCVCEGVREGKHETFLYIKKVDNMEIVCHFLAYCLLYLFAQCLSGFWLIYGFR